MLQGHSLGAGAASIAAFEFNQVDGIEAKSIGFGCPPLVSLELAEEARDYITNVIFDWDMVSRLSPAAMVNFLLDVMEFDWTDDARRDVQRMLSHLKKRSPGIVSDNIVTDNVVEKGMSVTDKMIEQLIRPTIKEKSSERVEQRLFVPGKCIHFYRDGEKIQGAICPNTFPAELDLHHRMLKDHSIRVGYDELFVYILNELGGK